VNESERGTNVFLLLAARSLAPNSEAASCSRLGALGAQSVSGCSPARGAKQLPECRASEKSPASGVGAGRQGAEC
jgi:hypothetical protein